MPLLAPIRVHLFRDFDLATAVQVFCIASDWAISFLVPGTSFGPYLDASRLDTPPLRSIRGLARVTQEGGDSEPRR